MDHKCTRCGYETERKHLLQRHLSSKKPCQELYSNDTRELLLQGLQKKYNDDAKQCEWCNKKFNNVNYFYTHRKLCQQKSIHQISSDTNTETREPSTGESNEDERIMKTEQENDELKTLIKKQQEQNDKMLTLLEQLVQKPQPNQSNQFIQINQQNQNNITLNAFGKESHSHLTNEQMTSFIQNREIVDLIKTINFNPDVPENHNIKRITSSKDWYKNQFLSVYNDNGEWTNNVKEKVLETVVNNGFKVMYKHFFDCINSDPMNVTEESADFTRWFNENFNNPKNFVKQIFAFTLDDKFSTKTE
jgi:hypothetical protein